MRVCMCVRTCACVYVCAYERVRHMTQRHGPIVELFLSLTCMCVWICARVHVRAYMCMCISARVRKEEAYHAAPWTNCGAIL